MRICCKLSAIRSKCPESQFFINSGDPEHEPKNLHYSLQQNAIPRSRECPPPSKFFLSRAVLLCTQHGEIHVRKGCEGWLQHGGSRRGGSGVLSGMPAWRSADEPPPISQGLGRCVRRNPPTEQSSSAQTELEHQGVSTLSSLIVRDTLSMSSSRKC